MLDAVEHIHSKEYCHRDLKLENFLIDEHFNLRVIDFGGAIPLSVTFDKSIRKTGYGTPQNMAPEFRAPVHDGTKTDIFALGCIL